MPDGYRLYAASPADFFGEGQVGEPLIIAAGTVTVWEGWTGPRVTDLLDVSETAASEITGDGFGNFRFWAPDTLGTLTVSTNDGATRYVSHPADIGDQLRQMRDDVATAQTIANDLIDPATGLVRPELLPPGSGSGGGGASDAEVAALREEVAGLRGEVTALRDLVVGGGLGVWVWDEVARQWKAQSIPVAYSGWDATAPPPPAPASGRAIWFEAP